VRFCASGTSATAGIPDVASTIDVANLSLGDDLGTSEPDLDNLIHTAIQQSVAAGVTYVVAAGNAGNNAVTTVPAKYPEVIAVSAFCDSDGKPGGLGPSLSHCNDDDFADFSNYGSVVDISAPGVDTRSLALGGGIDVMSGTSFSAPHVAGAVALYIAEFGRVGPSAVRSALIASEEKGPIPDDPSSEGRLSVGSFVPGVVAMGHGSGPVGDQVTVKLSSFPINSPASIRFDSKVVGTTTTDGTGAVWFKVTIPSATHGSHKITAIAGNSTGSSSFYVNASLAVSPNPNVYAQSVTFTAKGFKASETVNLSMTGPTPATLGSGMANSAGTVSISISGPAAIGGAYTAKALSGSGISATRAFTILPSMALSASSGSPGASIKTSIRGFQSGETYTVRYRNSVGATYMCSSKATTATGSSSCTGKIPSFATKGPRTIEVSGSKGTFLSLPFTVLAPSASSAQTPTTTPTKTVTPTPSATADATGTPGLTQETDSPTPTVTMEPTDQPTETATEVPTELPTDTATPTDTPTDIPTLEPTATASPPDGSPPAG